MTTTGKIYTGCYTRTAYKILREATKNFWLMDYGNDFVDFVREVPSPFLWGVKIDCLFHNLLNIENDGEIFMEVKHYDRNTKLSSVKDSVANALEELDFSCSYFPADKEKLPHPKINEGLKMMHRALCGKTTLEDMQSPLFSEFIESPLNPFAQEALKRRKADFLKTYYDIYNPSRDLDKCNLTQDFIYNTVTEKFKKYVGTLDETPEELLADFSRS